MAVACREKMLKFTPSSDGVAPRGALQPAPIRVAAGAIRGAVIPLSPILP